MNTQDTPSRTETTPETSDPAAGSPGNSTVTAPDRGARVSSALGSVTGAVRSSVYRVLGSARARPIRTVRILAVLAVVAALASGLLWWSVARHAATDNARIQAVATADDAIVVLLSYNYQTIGHQVSNTQNLLTGKFKDDYAQLVKTQIQPGAEQRHLQDVASLASTSVVSADPHHVVLLMFVNQQSQSNDSPTPTTTESRVRVTLDEQDRTWRISNLEPV